MAYANPSVQDFKSYFFRDFPYGTDMETSILDEDIAKAFQQTNININPDLWMDQSSYTVGYLFLTAHWLVIDLQMSAQGIAGAYTWLQSSKSVGSVSESFAIPQRILDDPYLAGLSQTKYGGKFLQLILPQLTGQIFIAPGSTRP